MFKNSYTTAYEAYNTKNSQFLQVQLFSYVLFSGHAYFLKYKIFFK
jgi:hypothetical protein